MEDDDELDAIVGEESQGEFLSERGRERDGEADAGADCLEPAKEGGLSPMLELLRTQGTPPALDQEVVSLSISASSLALAGSLTVRRTGWRTRRTRRRSACRSPSRCP